MRYIRHGYVIDPANGREGYYDIGIENGKIAVMEKKEAGDSEESGDTFVEELGKSGDSLVGDSFVEKLGKSKDSLAGNSKTAIDMDEIDASGCIIAPGLIDVHVHFRDPGFTYKEDMHSGALAAAAGGFTSVVLMANTKPVVDCEEVLRQVQKSASEERIHIVTCACATKGMKGKEPVDMKKLKALGAAGFTDDGIPLLDLSAARLVMEEAAENHVLLSFHEEDASLIGNNGINRGLASEFFGISGSPREAEITMIERDIELCAETHAAIHIQHISTAEGVELVRKAKKAGLPVSAEATPHHFSSTEELTIKKGTLAKMNPPLRTEKDRLAIIEGLRDGTIDVIATDHAPHSSEEKSRPITEAPSGIIGLETSLSLGLTYLVEKAGIPVGQLIEKMTCRPAALFQLEHRGSIGVGDYADLVIFDRNERVVGEQFFSKSVNSPFIGMHLQGNVRMTICEGAIVYHKDAMS